jgi:hypothetical protein
VNQRAARFRAGCAHPRAANSERDVRRGRSQSVDPHDRRALCPANKEIPHDKNKHQSRNDGGQRSSTMAPCKSSAISDQKRFRGRQPWKQGQRLRVWDELF